MKLFRENNEVNKNDSSIIISSRCERHITQTEELKVVEATENELCELIAKRTIKHIDEAFKTFKRVEYMININHIDRVFKITVNDCEFSDTSYEASENITIPQEYDLSNMEKEIIYKINEHYFNSGKRIEQLYVTTYQIITK